MLQPKRTKFRKQQKGRMKGNAGRGNQLAFGTFGIKSLDSNFLTSRQIEAARIAATRFMKREGSIWIMIFPDKPITKKPLEVRMGKGKGAVNIGQQLLNQEGCYLKYLEFLLKLQKRHCVLQLKSYQLKQNLLYLEHFKLNLL